MTQDALTVPAGRVHATFTMLRRGVQRLRGRRHGRAAFWHLGPERLVVAVIEPGTGDDEPLLTACATVSGRAQTPLAPGLLEAAVLVDARGLDHVAALDEPYCRIVPASLAEPSAQDRNDGSVVEVAGPAGSRLRAERDVLEWVVRLFEEANLGLVRVECAELARTRLADYLGATAGVDGRAPDPLTAVSVVTSCEAVAVELGALLAVPVGMAVARFLPWVDAVRAEPGAGPDTSGGEGR